MKFELPALHSEPLIYFLLHSGVFVFLMGALFFTLGLWFGRLTWGKYKLRAQAVYEENQSLLGEIAILKRKLAEQSLRPTNAPSAATALLTEVLPNVSEIFPGQHTLYPALTAMPSPQKRAAPAPEAQLPIPGPAVEFIESPNTAAEPIKPAVKNPELPAKPMIRAKAKQPAPEAALTIPTEPVLEVEPFGFLLAETGPSAPADLGTAGPTALEAIIKGKPSAKRSGATAKAGKTTKVKLPKSPPPITVPAPEIDPALGPIYREAPPNADDLTKIKGITGLLAKRLQELGVHTYHQIASWEDKHVREFSTRLAFKDRIAREGWVEQARSLEKARQSAAQSV